MPRVPKYSHHKSSGRAYVFMGGKRIYLGKHGSPESLAEYSKLISRYHATGSKSGSIERGVRLTINELVLAYKQHVEGYYVKNGELTTEVGNIARALKLLREQYGHTGAEDFRPGTLKMIRDEMIRRGLARTSINKDINRIRQMFKWAVAEEHVPPSVHHALQALAPLKKGRSAAKETTPVKPVPEADVKATCKHLPEVVADMVMLQYLTGARPCEVRQLRPGEIERTGDVWTYRPGSHKTEHHGIERVLLIGPKAQQILSPYLLRSPDAYCFQPAESEKRRHQAMRQTRKSKPTPSQQRRSQQANTTSNAAECYDRNAYTRAVTRAAEAAGVSKWTPNQLRHTRATEIRAAHGIEMASTILGHTELDTTSIYAERNIRGAIEIMRAIG